MAEAEEVERCKWDMDVIITVGKTGTSTIYIESPNMTMKEIEAAAEHIATHGVWWHKMLTPPNRIYSISVCKTDEEENVDQG